MRGGRLHGELLSLARVLAVARPQGEVVEDDRRGHTHVEGRRALQQWRPLMEDVCVCVCVCVMWCDDVM